MMDKTELLRSIRLYLFDMDGTLYLGNRLYSFTIELLQTLKQTGRRYLFMTNNSSKSVEDYIKKLDTLGIQADREDFITSSQATAYYLKKEYPGKRLYVCGTQSLKRELKREGFSVTENVDETDVIVMGFDTELTFQKLRDVSYLLLSRESIPYIATNPDYVCPTEFGAVPDCGSVCDMIFNATGKRPVVIGKPSPLMPQLAMEQWGYGKEAAFSEDCLVECDSRLERVRCLAALAHIEILTQQRTVVGVCAVLDDSVCTLHGVLAAKVGNTLLGDKDIH